MKLKFYKDENNDCIKIVTQAGDELDFDYIEMIQNIFHDKGIDMPDIDNSYSAEERESIERLIEDISSTVKTLF